MRIISCRTLVGTAGLVSTPVLEIILRPPALKGQQVSVARYPHFFLTSAEKLLHVMSAHPDALLPKLELSLRQFNNLANNLHDNPDPTIESHQKVMDYIRVVLEGRYTENDEERRIYIDGMKGLTPGSVIPYGLVPEQNEYQISRDFDSVIGYSDTLPYAIPIAAYVVPPFNEGIRKDLHIKTDITTLAVSVYGLCRSEADRGGSVRVINSGSISERFRTCPSPRSELVGRATLRFRRCTGARGAE